MNSKDMPVATGPDMRDGDKLAIYLHWPYCARICPYCDFNVYKARGIDQALSHAMATEIRGWRDIIGPRQVGSVHFGGGTPSLLLIEQVDDILSQIDDLWGISEDCEIGLEANPNDGQAAYWHDLSQAGVNRLSLGVQSFNDQGLKVLGRDHNGQVAKRALDLSLSLFPSVSLDLIYGWEGQSLKEWSHDIDFAVLSGAPHMSTYQLTIEPNTAFGRQASRGDLSIASEELSADMYDLVASRLPDSGFAHYEVSNFAKPNHRSQHNMAYWQGRDYLGIGPGAHGRVTLNGKRRALVAEATPAKYIKAVEETGFGIAEDETLSATQRAEEYLIMGLRISDGISMSRYEALAEQPLNKSNLESLSQDGLISLNGDRLTATDAGRRLLDSVTSAIIMG